MRRSSLWIYDQSGSGWPCDDSQIKVWRDFGPDGVRVLVRGLQRADHPIERRYRQFYRAATGWLPGAMMRLLPNPRDDSTRSTRMCIVQVLARLGNDAAIATPAMVRALRNEWVMLLDAHVDKQKEHDEAAVVLCQIGQPAIPALRAILRRRPGSIPETVRQAATRLHLLRPEALPLYEQQSRASRTAYMLADRANADISALIPDLRFQLIQSRYAESECARALVNAGPKGMADLTNLMVTGPRPVRDQAGWALGMAKGIPAQLPVARSGHTAGPCSTLGAFDPKRNESDLLFLKREAPDGPYAPSKGWCRHDEPNQS